MLERQPVKEGTLDQDEVKLGKKLEQELDRLMQQKPELRKRLSIGQLEPGDVLLSYATGPLSVLVWHMSGGPYSHSALFVGEERIVESVLKCTREINLAQSIVDTNRAHVHVYRYKDLSDDKADAIIDGARWYVDRKYSSGDLLYAAAAAKAAKGDNLDKRVFKILEELFGEFLETEQWNERVTCVELLTRAFHESGAHLDILPVEQRHASWVDIGAAMLGVPTLELKDDVDHGDWKAFGKRLADTARRLMTKMKNLGRGHSLVATPAHDWGLHLVSPYELSQSPSLEAVGHLDVEAIKAATRPSPPP